MTETEEVVIFEVSPTMLESATERPTTQVPLKRFPSSPFTVAVMSKLKLRLGVVVEAVKTIEYAKLTTGNELVVAVCISVALALMVKVFAERILKFEKVISPDVVEAVNVPTVEPDGVRDNDME